MEISLLSLSLALLLSNTLPLTSTSNLTTDREALLAFHNSITDPNNVLTNNWSTHTPICSWTGVSCGPKHRRVTALNVSGHSLRGTISPHLGNLSFLHSLDISANNLTGSIPFQLSALRRLREMNLASNQITGPLPDGMFLSSSLVEIDVRDNLLLGGLPEDMCGNVSTKLKRMYLSGNQFYGEVPTNIYKCRELEDLRLSKNRFGGNVPSEIGSLPMLQILSLWSNNFSGIIPSSIFNISSLTHIDLSENSLYGSIPTDNFHSLLNIQELFLSSNKLTGHSDRDSNSQM